MALPKTSRPLTFFGTGLVSLVLISTLTIFYGFPGGRWKSLIHDVPYYKQKPAGANATCPVTPDPWRSYAAADRWKSHVANASWEFIVERDGDNYSLTDEQCQTAFPLLFEEIEKSVAGRRSDPITFEELNSRSVKRSMVRGMIYDGDVCLSDTRYASFNN